MAPPPSSRWRWLVVVLVPVVAVWDGGRGLLRAWGEFGMRMLEKLDPLFARLTALTIRIQHRLDPFFERIRRSAERIATKLRPGVERITGVLHTINDAIGRFTARLGRWFAPVATTFRRARRLLGTPFRFVGCLVARAAGAARGWCSARWQAAAGWVRASMPAR